LSQAALVLARILGHRAAVFVNCSIVIRAYNEEQHLGRLLEGLRRQTVRDVEIILVDSGSSDGTVARAESFGARIVRIPPAEFTFGRSLNYGVRAATRERVVIASAHVYPVYPDWLETLLRPFEDEQIALTYGKQRGPASAHFSEQQIYQQWYPDHSQPRQATVFCNNANAAIRKSLWEKNPYDETLTGLEDLAWAKWTKEQGYAIAYVAEAEIIHVHNETPQGVFNRYRREGMAFKQIYSEAHFSLYDFLRLTAMNVLSDLWHAAREGVLWKNLSSIFWFRFLQFHGTRLGYRESGLLTPQLRETFYYARARTSKASAQRDIEPIRYHEK
jgi:glycosyltransferase involved in cell wall biosynthesis